MSPRLPLRLPFALIAASLGGLLIAALALAWLFYEHELRRERARVSSGSAVVATGCGPIEFASVGSRPAVLLVHGAGGGFDQMLGVAQELAPHGLRVIALLDAGSLVRWANS